MTAKKAPGHTDLMVTPESMTPWLARDGAAKTICDFMGWPEDGVAFADAIRLAEQLGFKLLSTAPPTRTPEELESLLSLALGALEPFLRHLEPWMNERHPDERVTVFSRHTFGELRQASQVTAQIKGGQESMASSARSEPK